MSLSKTSCKTLRQPIALDGFRYESTKTRVLAGLDLGPLAVGSRLVQFPGGPLPVHNLVKFD